MKGFRKAALPIISVLIAAIISLTSVTFAWFTYGNEAKVEQIEVGVETAGGLQMSIANAQGTTPETYAFNWNSVISVNDLIGNVKLTPVSTSGSVANGILKFFAAQFDNSKDKIYNSEEIEGIAGANGNSNYITFDLYFRNAENVAKTVDLNNTLVKAITGQSNLAVRIGFVMDSTVKSTAAVGVTPWTGNTGSTSIIYEPNATQHTDDGVRDYKLYKGGDGTGVYAYQALVAESKDANVYYDRYTGETFTLVQNRNNALVNNGQYYIFDSTAPKGMVSYTQDKDYIKMSANEAAAELALHPSSTFYTLENSNYIVVDTAASGFEFDTNKDYYLLSYATVYEKATPSTNAILGNVTTVTDYTQTFFTLGANTISKVSVFIWIEGQDADCTNYVAGNPFSVDLVFNAKEVI